MTGKLRIGVNALYLIPGGVGGTEIYLRRLLEAMQRREDAHEFILYTNRETAAGLVPAHPRFVTDGQPVHAVNRPARIAWEQTGLRRALDRQRIDVLLNPGFTAPRWPGRPSVTVFHDLQHKRHPEHFRWFDLPFWQLLLRQSALHSDRLIAVSEATAADLRAFYGVERERVTVVPHGVEQEFFRIGSERSVDGERPYLLCVSTLHPHKNLPLLIRAFGTVRRERPELRLVLAGMKGFETAALEEQVRTAGLQGAVEFTGWIPRVELYKLFRRATAFVYPSMFEGFGMPVLEALAAGLPTVCSDIPPLREIADGVATFFQPRSEEDLVRALREVLRGNDSGALGPERARPYTWERAAAMTLDVLERSAK